MEGSNPARDFLLGVSLDELSSEHQRDDDRCGIEIQMDVAAERLHYAVSKSRQDSEREQDFHPDISVYESPPCQFENGEPAVENNRRRHGHQNERQSAPHAA